MKTTIALGRSQLNQYTFKIYTCSILLCRALLEITKVPKDMVSMLKKGTIQTGRQD